MQNWNALNVTLSNQGIGKDSGNKLDIYCEKVEFVSEQYENDRIPTLTGMINKVREPAKLLLTGIDSSVIDSQTWKPKMISFITNSGIKKYNILFTIESARHSSTFAVESCS